MKSILKKLFIFILPIIVLCIFFEIKVRNVINSVNKKKVLLNQQKDEIEILVFGSSYAYAGINPDFINLRTFNLANTAQDLYYDYELLKNVINMLPKLKMIIISISYQSFEYKTTSSIDYARSFLYSHTFRIPNENFWRRFDPRNISLFALYEPYNVWQYTWKDFKVDLATNMNSTGWGYVKYDHKVKFNDVEGKELLAYLNNDLSQKNLSQNKLYLESIIKLTKNQHIKLLLITPPVSEEFMNQMNQNRYKRMQNEITEISQKYDITYLNFIDDRRFKVYDFADLMHLNDQGAEKFSLYLDRVINDVVY